MIAPGTRVLFTDRHQFGGNLEPHNGQVGTVTDSIEDGHTLVFADGQHA